MRTITKKEMTDHVADKIDEKRSIVKNIIQRFLDEVVDELAKGNRLEFRDFGVFTVRMRKSRMAQNPRTMERVPVPVKCCVKFKTGRHMRDRVQKGTTEVRSTRSERKVQPSATAEAPPPPTS
jgi:integration host factor subunit beta